VVKTRELGRRKSENDCIPMYCGARMMISYVSDVLVSLSVHSFHTSADSVRTVGEAHRTHTIC